MLCPTCVIELRMTDRHGVEIDYCPQCRGVWLDRGELDKIIERTAADMAPAPPPPPPAADVRYERDYRERHHRDDDYRDDKRRKGKRRESWLSELFDWD